ncbi:hypothetical protein Tco_0722457 [Tanacetum coccineum]
MAFVSASFNPRFPQTNNQLRTSSNPRNQATIQDGILTVQTVQGRETPGYVNTGVQNNDTNQGAKAVLMANLSSYDLDVLLEVPFHDTNIDDISYQSVQETQCSEQLFFDNDIENDITSDSNIASYEQYLQETENPVIVDRNAKVADFEKQIHSLKLQLNATVESHKTLSTIVECLKRESKQKEDKYLDEVINLQNKNKALDNVVYKMARWKVPALYDGYTIVKTHVALSVTDTQEALELAKESRTGIWLPISQSVSIKPLVPSEPVLKMEIPRELPSISMHIICQDVMNTIMHANDHYDNVLPANYNSLDHDNSALDLLKQENDHLIELLISQDLVHTIVNSLAAINDYKYMQQSFVDEYNETLVLKG